MCVFVCVYMYMYICICAHMYIRIYVHMHICLYAYMYMCIYTHIHVCTETPRLPLMWDEKAIGTLPDSRPVMQAKLWLKDCKVRALYLRVCMFLLLLNFDLSLSLSLSLSINHDCFVFDKVAHPSVLASSQHVHSCRCCVCVVCVCL